MSEEIFYQDKDGIYRGENAEKMLSYLLEEVDYCVGKRKKVSRYQICNDYYALGYYYNKESKLWCAFDNATGDCFVEVFKSAEEAEKWVNRVEEDEEDSFIDDTVDKSNDCKRCDSWRGFFSDRDSDTYCPDCGNLIIQSTESLIDEAEYWWRHGASLKDYEVATGLDEYDFSPANDCKEFIDECYDIWNSKTNAEKIMIWKTINFREEY